MKSSVVSLYRKRHSVSSADFYNFKGSFICCNFLLLAILLIDTVFLRIFSISYLFFREKELPCRRELFGGYLESSPRLGFRGMGPDAMLSQKLPPVRMLLKPAHRVGADGDRSPAVLPNLPDRLFHQLPCHSLAPQGFVHIGVVDLYHAGAYLRERHLGQELTRMILQINAITIFLKLHD